MMDELVIEEASVRANLVKMDYSFCTAMFRAIEAGEERAPTTICTIPGTRKPIVVLSPRP
jgi:hypothetical protein